MKRMVVAYIAALVLLSGCGGEVAEGSSMPAAVREPSAEKAQSDRLLQALQSETDGQVTQYLCADFDGDGKAEGFASLNGLSNQLWFLSENGADCLYDVSSEMLRMQPVSLHGDGAPSLVLAEWNESASKTRSLAFSVRDGQVHQAETTKLMDLTQIAANEFTARMSDFDGSSEGTGHTWKRYWFYWDEETAEFCEYGGIPVTLEEVLAFVQNGDELMELVVENQIASIFYRGNGILNINLQSPPDEAGICRNSNLTFRYGADGQPIEEAVTDGGIYREALNFDAAVYPKQLGERLG